MSGVSQAIAELEKLRAELPLPPEVLKVRLDAVKRLLKFRKAVAIEDDRDVAAVGGNVGAGL